MEMLYGVKIMPEGKKRATLMRLLEQMLGTLGQRIAGFDDEAAQAAADLLALRHQKERPVDLRDTMIAGIVIAHRATLATRNAAHFVDIPATVVNPWQA